MDDSLTLTLSIVFGIVGGGYLLYGWKEKHIMATLAGVGLSVVPMFTSNTWVIGIVGAVCLILPFVFRE